MAFIFEPHLDSFQADCPSPRGTSADSRENFNGQTNELLALEQSNLTSHQLQIWMGQSLIPEVPIYNLTVALKIQGVVDPVHFGKAFQVLINSSDALRTVIEEIDGVPVQKILTNLPYTTSFVDLSSLPDAPARAHNWMLERSNTILDRQRRLFDSTLIKLAETEFVWCLVLHHLISDSWSFELIYRHLADLYRRSVQGELPDSLELFPFANYVSHERVQRNSPRHRSSEAYWKEFLSETGDETFFYGKAREKTTTRVRRVSRDLGSERTSRLRAVLASVGQDTEQASVLQIFAAILVGYLHCLNGKESYVIGIPFHNRRSKTFKETIGFFSEVLPVRISVGDDETFVSLLAKFKAAVFQAARHGGCAVVNPYFKRLYDVVLNYHTRSFSDFAGMAALPQWIHNGHGDESLTVQMSDFGSSKSLAVDFDLHEAIFSAQQSEQAASHFLRVLDAFLADPQQSLRRLTLLSPEEAQRFVMAWNQTRTEPLEERCAHHLFEDQVKQRPDALAVVLEDERLSYQELNRRANHLAHRLQSFGAGPETLVGLYVERSPEMIIGILGILKAGAAYVPMDPGYPEEWVNFVVADTQMAVLVTQEKLLERVAGTGPRTLCLDAEAEDLSQESADDIDSGVAGHHLAYIIYTLDRAEIRKAWR